MLRRLIPLSVLLFLLLSFPAADAEATRLSLPDPLIQSMIEQVTSAQVMQYDRDFSGELPGLLDPEQIYIIGGNLDAVQGTPGADDNAGGSVGTLVAADILSQYRWGCTLRFAFWTGEE